MSEQQKLEDTLLCTEKTRPHMGSGNGVAKVVHGKAASHYTQVMYISIRPDNHHIFYVDRLYVFCYEPRDNNIT